MNYHAYESCKVWVWIKNKTKDWKWEKLCPLCRLKELYNSLKNVLEWGKWIDRITYKNYAAIDLLFTHLYEMLSFLQRKSERKFCWWQWLTNFSQRSWAMFILRILNKFCSIIQLITRHVCFSTSLREIGNLVSPSCGINKKESPLNFDLFFIVHFLWYIASALPIFKIFF